MMFEIVSLNVSPRLWADYRWDVVTSAPAPAPGRRLPAPGILDTGTRGHILCWGVQNGDSFINPSCLCALPWMSGSEFEQIWAEYSPLSPDSVGVTQREFWVCCLIQPWFMICGAFWVIICFELVDIMSSQRVFDAGDMYWACEDLIIDDEAENDFLCLVVWRHGGGLCRLQETFMSA